MLTALGCAPATRSAADDSAQTRRLTILLVADGLRPDAVTPATMPVLSRLRDEGVTWGRAHAAHPSVTRTNSATLGTGATPARHGIVSNAMYVPGVDSSAAFNTGDPRTLMAMAVVEGGVNGRVVSPRSMAERLTSRGGSFVAVSAGSGGNALLNNPRAPFGVGTLINVNLGLLDTGRIAFPDRISRDIRARFGMPPPDSTGPTLNGLQNWSDRVVREYVLPELKPHVLMLWTAEPDEAQHRFGAGSPEALSALANLDRNIGLLLRTLDSLGVGGTTNLIVTSDHGFAWNKTGVNVADSLVAAGLKESRASSDVVVASDGQSIQLHVRGHDAARSSRLATWLGARPWVDAVFAPAKEPGDRGEMRCDSTVPAGLSGWIPGTVALEVLDLCHVLHSPDLLVTFPWTDEPNAFGIAGTQLINVAGAEGAIAGNRGGHGGLSPWAVRTTLIARGPAFRRGVVVDDVPAGNVDIPMTILALARVRDTSGMDGRVLCEGLRDARSYGCSPSPPSTRVLTDTIPGLGGRRVVVVRSVVNGATYVDQARRLP